MDQVVKQKLDAHREDVNKYIENLTENGAEAQTYEYSCTVKIATAVGGYLAVEFSKDGKKYLFEGGFAGGFGGYYGWGKAWFNTPVEDLVGKAAGFVVEVIGVLGGTAHVQITGDRFIGNCSTGGLGAGGGIGAGGGEFKRG